MTSSASFMELQLFSISHCSLQKIKPNLSYKIQEIFVNWKWHHVQVSLTKSLIN